MAGLDDTNIVFKIAGKNNSTIVTYSRIRTGKTYSNKVLGEVTTSDGKKRTVTCGKFIDRVADDFKTACKNYKKTAATGKGIDDAVTEKRLFREALWGMLGYTGKYSNDSIKAGFKSVWNSGRSLIYGSFKNWVDEIDKTNFDTIFSNPVEYMLSSWNADLIEKNGGEDTGTGLDLSSITETLSGFAKYALIGVGCYFIIKSIK